MNRQNAHETTDADRVRHLRMARLYCEHAQAMQAVGRDCAAAHSHRLMLAHGYAARYGHPGERVYQDGGMTIVVGRPS